MVALGNFDGVHRGHRQVIQPILSQQAAPPVVAPNPDQHPLQCLSAWETPDYSFSAGMEWQPSASVASTNRDLSSSGSDQPRDWNGSAADGFSPLYPPQPHTTVVTFFPHPQEFFSGQPRVLLTPLQEKALHLKTMGVEQLVLLPFNRSLANLSPRTFVEEVLIRRLQAQYISVGMDFRFGHQRAGRVDDLCAIATQHGIQVHVVPLETLDGERISSSAIREALQSGDVQQATHLLGRPYTLTGRVIMGQKLGRTIGFPTANLKLPPEKFLPRDGVYGVRVYADASVGQSPQIGVMNIGHRPTVQGVQRTIEVHLLDWSGDLYGKTLTVSLEQFLRSEQKFDSLDALKRQIQADCQAARQQLVKH